MRGERLSSVVLRKQREAIRAVTDRARPNRAPSSLAKKPGGSGTYRFYQPYETACRAGRSPL